MKMSKINLTRKRIKYDLLSILDVFVLFFSSNLFFNTAGKYRSLRSKNILKYFNGVYFDFNGIKIPKLKKSYLDYLAYVFEDIFLVYLKCNNNYSYKIIDDLEEILPEGTYCYYSKNSENININKGDVVIDAGAWVGDFAAYASKMGEKVYAFEPNSESYNYLRKTAKLNGNIIPIKKGLGSSNGFADFSNQKRDNRSKKNLERVETLDYFIKTYNIKKVDFIKADIEGDERHLLLGAKYVIKKFEPIISICTYHLEDDPVVLETIIKKINPNYKIIHRKKKLFAFVPNK